ncbi:chemotaxis protein CheZ [Erwinia typographi]|uniref:Protein phosphatase CheZ n=1 Tax=Erwinia typographi TaxID=371042 RepID=A0A0A3Z6Z7_9GAMM|nr:protein phosphatase CheZ [Erwinia typographi]KGT93421.1 chemotaxis protein CheZ [Erwinia typographi]
MGMTEKKKSDDHIKDIFSRIGGLTRLLRNSMSSLGLDRAIMEAAEAIPDTRARLNYVVGKTSEAADRALTCVEVARPLQGELTEKSQALTVRWDKLLGEATEVPEARELVFDTRAFLSSVPDIAGKTDQQLMEIMMAQDFQDLTGQVIKKLMDLIESIERELIQVLIENMPESAPVPAATKDSLKNGPQVDHSKAGVVATQDQVDDLLENLGF